MRREDPTAIRGSGERAAGRAWRGGAIGVIALLGGLVGCGLPNPGTLFGGGSTAGAGGAVGVGGAGGSIGVGGAGGAAGVGGGAGVSASSASSSSSTTASASSSSSVSSSSSSSSTSSGGPVCGNGICEPPETTQLCHQDCPGPVCGNGVCEPPDETAVFCPQDCNGASSGAGSGSGSSSGNPGSPTCPHSVCNGSAPNTPLSGDLCKDPCVSTVCAQKPDCCGGNGTWTQECQTAAAACGGEPCILSVCAVKPSCCTQAWTQECVTQAKTTCGVTCNCGHSICQQGAKMPADCNPCATYVCQVDPFCCDNDWDGACVNEVETVCGIVCN